MAEAPKKKRRDWARWAAWSLTGVALLATARINAKPKETQERSHAIFQMRRELNHIWLVETGDVDALNRMAKEHIKKNNLAPGDPLPPNTFFKSGDPLLENLDKPEATQLMATYKVNAAGLESPVVVTTGISDTVPEPGEPYAATALEADPEVAETALWIHPQKEGTLKMIKEAKREIGRKSKKIGAGNEKNP